jgi:hypothetical protein
MARWWQRKCPASHGSHGLCVLRRNHGGDVHRADDGHEWPIDWWVTW